MGEQRYKVGDFVRVKDNRGAPRDYNVGDVCQVTKIEDDIVRCSKAGMFDFRFEPWQPRVGERVRVSRSKLSHKSQLIGREFKVTHQAYILNDGAQSWGGDNAGGYVWRADELEPILATATPEQPASLKIEAGKFYKTRDGRKVGPIVANWADNEHWPFRWPEKTMYCKSNGYSCPGSAHLHRDADDIVAEWIDEPVVATNDNAQPKFKVGDAIRHKALRHEGVVTAVIDERTVRTHWTKEGWGATDPIDEIELITPPAPKPTTIVALIENGQPKPSSTPHVHASTGAAEKEAKRLAAKFKGKQFGVFTLTTTHHEQKPVYDHKWQNLAALGLKIDAIKELRSITGMGLKPAKDAVEYFLAAA